jgi:GLPGLI family protein
MKKSIVLLAFFLIGLFSFGQSFQGMAVYESKTSTADFKKRMEGNKNITPDMQKMIEERMKTMFEKTFILNFDKTSSIYKEEEKLETPGGNTQVSPRFMASIMGGGGTFYKNTKEKSYTVDKEFMGKEFLVKDSLSTLKWKMESESKEIGGYLCMKATAVKPISKTDFRNFRPKKEVKPEEGKTESKTNLMDDLELPKEAIITAWYTPDIPVNQGPESYWGLPGLILEVSDGKTIVLCSKIVMNVKDKIEIKAPTNGKVLSQAEYDDIVVKKMKEMQEMNQGRNSQGGNPFRMGR